MTHINKHHIPWFFSWKVLFVNTISQGNLKKKQPSMSPFLLHVAPGDFAGKHVLKLVEWFSGHCHAIKSQNLTQSCLQVVQFAARRKILACEV